MTAPVRILDCTLRDGSYVVDFQFTAEDTIVLAGGLENAGLPLVEIGHGLGLNASRSGKGRAGSSDEEYLQAAASTLTRAAWGMFFIPGIGRLDDLDLAARYRMPFVRIGTNANDVEQAQPFIAHAKSLGMTVSANLMKSYGLSAVQLAANAVLVERAGCDVVTLVDSAGTMLPGDIHEYIRVLRSAVGVPIGFHGHDNLRLGVANTLTAIECGATVVDTTLQGIGRGGGNAPTEVVVAVLKRQHLEHRIDLHRLMDLSDRVVRPMLRKQGVDPIDVTSGYAGFHSSNLMTILQHAARHDVDARDLIEAVCEIDRMGAPEEVVDRVARQLRDHRRQSPRDVAAVTPPLRPRAAPVDGTATFEAALREQADALRTRCRKSGHQSVVNVVAATSRAGPPLVSPFIQEQFGFVIGSVEVSCPAHVETVTAVVDGIVDVMLVDSELKPYLERPLSAAAAPRRTVVFAYKDSDVWVRAVALQIDAMARTPHCESVAICGCESSALKLALALAERGFGVTLTGEHRDVLARAVEAIHTLAVGPTRVSIEPDLAAAAAAARLFVPFTERRGLVDAGIAGALASGTVVFVASVGSVTPEAIEAGLANGVRFVRPDMRAALGAELDALAGARRLATELMGQRVIGGVHVVAGGVIGRRGDVIVDSIARPTRVVGIADGRGAVIYDHFGEYADRVRAVEAEVWRARFA